jgi:protein-S-isoprenylcysteine O-methyltransferase Ste14
MEGPALNAFTVVQVVAVGALLWIVFSLPVPWDWQRGIGSALVLAGVAGVAVARYQLGKSFSVTAQARQLITHGIYSKIRNPIYVFASVVIAGLVLVLHRPVAWLFLIAVIIVQTLRAHREAQVLEAAFGEAYRVYRSQTWF